jgi:short-subunit dehydrogenase
MLGGSKGIGKALASELIRRGCSTVIIVARNQEQLENARNELSEKCCPGQRVWDLKLFATRIFFN